MLQFASCRFSLVLYVRPFCMHRLILCAALALVGAAEPLVDVFVGRADGYACYRIPASVRNTVNGNLLAISEARRYNCGDAGYVDLVSKLSTDGGATWGALALIRSESGASNVTIGNPSPVLLSNGSIVLPFCRNNLGVGMLRSDDFGSTWSLVHFNLSLPSDFTWVATGPPGGIALSAPSTRLLVPIDFRSRSTGNAYYSRALLSDDGGASWRLGSGSVSGGDECQVSELTWASPASPFRPLLLSSRSSVGNRRLAALSTDGGDTWGTPWQTIQESECEASTVALPVLQTLVMSSAFATTRINMTLHVSADNGRSWKPYATIYAGPSAYSSLVALGDGASVGLLFERDGYAKISYVPVTVSR